MKTRNLKSCWIAVFVGILSMIATFNAFGDVPSIDSINTLVFSLGDSFWSSTAMVGFGSIDLVMKQMDRVESDLNTFTSASKSEIKNIGDKQLELANRLVKLERFQPSNDSQSSNWGGQIVENATFKDFLSGSRSKTKIDVQNNTLTGSDSTVAPDRRPGVSPGAFAPLKIEDLFEHIPTSSNAIEFTKENVFTNSAAEAAEGATMAESSLTMSLVNMPVSTVGHFIKISKQLAEDSVALASYVNRRLEYGVNRRVENQLANGNGTAPNISGIFDTGNFAAHGYADAILGTGLKKYKLLRRVIADLVAAGYAPGAVLLNPNDWLQFEIDLIEQIPAGITAADIANGFQTRIFGVPVIQSIGVTADTFAVLDAKQAGRIFDRQAVTIELSESDSDNFVKNLITVRAERRLALAIDQPNAIIAGDLTPA